MGFPALTQAQINKISFGEGLVIFDDAVAATELSFAPVRGGGAFEVTPKIRDIEFDGRRGKTKGMQVIEEMEAKMTLKSLVCSQDVMSKLLPGSNYPSQQMVTNGSFTGGATGWTLGSGWAYGTNAVAHTAGVATATQSLTVVTGRSYRLSFDLTRTAGDLTVTLTNATGTSGALILTATGVEVIFVATATGAAVLTFTPSTDFAGTIDNVSVKCTTIYSSDIGLIPTTQYGATVHLWAKLLDGTYKKIRLSNPMHEGPMKFATNPKGEVELDIEFFAHYDATVDSSDVWDINDVASYTEEVTDA